MSENKPHVFAIDDEKDALEIFEEALAKSFDIELFSDPEVALKELEKRQPDIVVTDIMMPNMDGVTLVRKLKRISKTLPVIVMSGHSDRNQIIEIFKLGCFDFVSKPFRYDELAQKIHMVLDENNSIRDNFEQRILKDSMRTFKDGESLVIGFNQDVLSHNELSQIVRKEIYRPIQDHTGPVRIDLRSVKTISSENLVILHSFMKHLDSNSIKYDFQCEDDAVEILLSSEFHSAGEAI